MNTPYFAEDLDSMEFAVNYHRWIYDIFKPFIGKRIVEVGAGTGLFSKLLLENNPDSLSLIEPSQVYNKLTKQIHSHNTTTKIKTYNSIFTNVCDEIKHNQNPDTIVYINVLEHIEDDLEELATMNKTLCTAGHILIFVPALSWAYGTMDELLGHYRRYTLSELKGKCEAAGFSVVSARYFDFVGIFPWWLRYRVLKSKKFMEPSAVKFFDTYIVPIIRRVESNMRFPLGKNLILIAEKRSK
ncbi:MAG: class I SAM-dependent methyltransferase [Chlorobiales bacterium]|jgi:hypothetical protein|nr:class I SAM-dependent methyltransferase [Chlorobiales bacterium]